MMYFTADPMPARRLLQYGAVAEVVPGDQLFEAAQALARRMIRHSGVALRHAKESLNVIEAMDLKTGYEFEQRMTGRLCGLLDAREVLRAATTRANGSDR